MTLFGYSSNPDYPDRYDRTKKWVKVLPVAGRHIQTAEFTEIQSIVQDNLKQGMNTLFKSGSPVTGLRIAVVSRTNDSLNISVSKGQIYVEGFILDVDESIITVPIVGEYTIGVNVNEAIITEKEDPSLRDPIKGGDFYGTPGAARCVWTTSVELIDDNNQTYAIGKVLNGVILQKELNPFYQIEKILAQYTHERSGHFCVSGHEVSSLGTSKRGITDENKYSSLQVALDNAQTQQQNSLSEVIATQESINTLKSQLAQAVTTTNLSPTSLNLARVADLENRLNSVKTRYDSLASQLVEKDRLLQSAKTSLSSASNLLVDKELFSITPGVSYVEGYRISKPNPETIIIPRDLPKTTVDSATFIYQGITAKSLRRFSLTSYIENKIVAPEGKVTILSIKVNNIVTDNSVPSNLPLKLGQEYSIEIQYKIDNSATSVKQALTNWVNEFNNTSSQINPKFSYKLFNSSNVEITTLIEGGFIPPSLIRLLLKNSIQVFIQDDTNLLFESKKIGRGSETVEVEIDIKIVDIDGVETRNSIFVVDIPKAYLAGGEEKSNYQLGFRPVGDIIKLVAVLEEVNKPVIRGITPGTSDYLGDDSITKIIQVRQGDTVFIENTDYTLDSQSKINWRPDSGNEPVTGSTYYITFQYTQALGIGQDYILDKSTDSIVFTGRTPAFGTSFAVDYSYYLAKAGIITLDKEGTFSYVLSSAATDPIVPTIPDNVLGLAGFKFYADKTEVIPLNCKRQTVEDLYNLAQRVRDNTKNTEILKLDLQSIRQLQTINTYAIGTFNDPIQDFSKINLEQSTAAIVPAIQGFTGGYNQVDVALRYRNGGQVHDNELNIEQFVTLPYASTSFINQSRVTSTRTIVPHNSAIKKRGKLFLSEYISFDNGPYKNITPCDALSNSSNILSIHSSPSPISKTIISSVNNLLGPTGYKVADSLESGDALSFINENINSFTQNIFNTVKANKFKQITVKAEGLGSGVGGFRLYFSGKEILEYQLLDNTPASMNPIGSIKTKADGSINLKFNIPENTSCGVHTIELISDKGYAKSRISIYNNLLTQVTLGALKSWGNQPIATNASKFLPLEYSDYVSEDLLRLGLDTSNYPSISSPFQGGTVQSSVDYPIRHECLSQTFELPEYYFITGINLKLKSGPTKDSSLKIHLRGADDLPNKITYGIAKADTYNYSNFGTEQTLFTFSYPILLSRSQRYTIALESRGGEFEIFTGQLGKKDIVDDSILGNQLYLEGDLFTSPDGVSLNLYDREDLSYQCLRAEFNTNQIAVDLGTYGAIDLYSQTTYFCLNSRDIVPANTEILYEYATCLNSTTCNPWVRFKPNVITCLPSPTSLIKLRALLSSSFSNLSPVLSLAGSTVSLYSGLETSHIISKAVEYPDAYQYINITIDFIKPLGTNIKVFYSPTRGYDWEGPEWIECGYFRNNVALIDESLKLYRVTFSKSERTTFYTRQEPRKRFRYKIQLITTIKSAQPVVKNITTYVK